MFELLCLIFIFVIVLTIMEINEYNYKTRCSIRKAYRTSKVTDKLNFITLKRIKEKYDE